MILKDFYYVCAPRTDIEFVCKIKEHEFLLIPSSKIIYSDNSGYYSILIIEIYDYSPEELGLVNLDNLEINRLD